MKSFLIIVSGLAFTGVAKAVSCSASNAEPVTVDTGSNGGGSNGGGGRGGGEYSNPWVCIDPQTLENRCGEIEFRRLARSPMNLSIRNGLDCTSSEACISLQGEVICYNPTTDDFHIADGSKGNFRTGDYLLPDGQRGNYFNGPNPILSSSAAAGASGTIIRSSNVASSTKSVSMLDATDATVTSTIKSSNPTAMSPAFATTNPTSATTTPNASNRKRGHGHLLGAVVGMAGLLAL